MRAMMRDIHYAPILRLFVPELRDTDLFIERVLRVPRVAAQAAS
jgi:hypothetical protein